MHAAGNKISRSCESAFLVVACGCVNDHEDSNKCTAAGTLALCVIDDEKHIEKPIEKIHIL